MALEPTLTTIYSNDDIFFHGETFPLVGINAREQQEFKVSFVV